MSAETSEPSAFPTPGSPAALGRAFVSTHWSLVLKAAPNNTTHAQQALGALCQAYWYPLYAHARRRGYSAPDAQDLTQAFFAQLIERQTIACATPERGRFRSFLLAAMNNFLATEWHKARAQKRGGGAPILSLDLAAAEERYAGEPADTDSPDKAYDRRWALQLLQSVLEALEQEHAAPAQARLFTALKQTLTGDRESLPYARLAAELDITESAVKVAVHRLRSRYRALVRERIAQTVASSGDIDSEMKLLLHALAGR